MASRQPCPDCGEVETPGCRRCDRRKQGRAKMKAAYDRDPERFRQRTRDYHATDAGRETHRRSRRLDKKRNAARVRATERRRTAMPEVKKRTKANRKRLRSADPEGARAKDRANARKWRAMNRSRWNSYQRARRYGLTPAERSEEHTSELQSHHDLVCRLLL